MKNLFLHGWQSIPGGVKPTFLIDHGQDVINPVLPDEDFDESVRIAEAEYDEHQPDVIVGSSRGGAVAMNIDSKDTPMVLLCPAWKTWGTVTTVKPNTTILHSRQDETVPFEDSLELLKNSGLPESALIEVGHEHRLADEESLAAMVRAVERAVTDEESGGTPNQEILWEFLRSSQPTPAAKALLKRTMQRFVLEYGWWYEPAELPKHVSLGTPQQCHKNAMDLAMADDSLIYCEGYALFKGSSLPTLHAWVTDGQGEAIDNTWPQAGVAYAGVPFRVGFVTTTALKNDAIGSLLDDYTNGYPLRGDLGDRPEEWLEPRGGGKSRVGCQNTIQ
jgi:hypothetical protein